MPAVVTGFLIIVFTAGFILGMRVVLSPGIRWLGGVFLMLPGLGVGVTGIFTAERSTVGIHSAASSLGLLGAVVAFLIAGYRLRRDVRWRRWSTYSIVAGLTTLVLLAVEFLAANPRAPLAAAPIGGLVERILVIELLAWYVAFGWRLFRGSPAEPPADAGR